MLWFVPTCPIGAACAGGLLVRRVALVHQRTARKPFKAADVVLAQRACRQRPTRSACGESEHLGVQNSRLAGTIAQLAQHTLRLAHEGLVADLGVVRKVRCGTAGAPDRVSPRGGDRCDSTIARRRWKAAQRGGHVTPVADDVDEARLGRRAKKGVHVGLRGRPRPRRGGRRARGARRGAAGGASCPSKAHRR